jgi:hypothetical protein
MTNMEKLLSIASEPLATEPLTLPELIRPYSLGTELFRMLQTKNGFYAFESALHVFPLTGDSETGLEAWNAGPLWRDDYEDLAVGLLFFAEDILQDQFCLSLRKDGVLRFFAETGQTEHLASSIEEWAGMILSDYPRETGWPFVHEWQAKNGPLARGKRLMPKTPFFLGGEYGVDNLWAGNPLEGMRLKADLAMQTRHLPEGAQVKLNVATKPEEP